MGSSVTFKFFTFLLVIIISINGISLAAEKTTEQILDKYPSLKDYFPFGIWLVDDEGYSNIYPAEFNEPYFVRLEKIYDDFSRNYFTAIIPSNRKITKQHLDLAQKYGMRLTTLPYLLHSQMNYMGKPSGDSINFELIKQQWSKHISEIKDHPALLSYQVFDEIHPDAADSVREMVEYVEKLDSFHPATYTHQCLPFTGWDNEKKLMDAVDIKLSDCYSVCRAYGRDPWMYGDVALPEWRRTNSNAIEWVIVPAFDWQQSMEIGELRVFVYHTIGNGAKGIFFFASGQVWFTWGENPIWPAIGDVWFNQNVLLSELSRIGYQISAIGPLLVSMNYYENYPITVQCNTLFAKVSGWLRTNAFIDMPAIHTGVFAGDKYDIVVVSNNDPWKSQNGTVKVTAKSEDVKIYDLYDLKPVNCSRSGLSMQFDVQFEAGDGKLYLIGSDDSFKIAKNEIYRHRYQNLHRMAERDLSHLIACRADGNAAKKFLNRAETSAEKGDYENAVQSLSKFNFEIDAAKKAKQDMLLVSSEIESTRKAFGEIDAYFYQHPDISRGKLCSKQVEDYIQQAKTLTKEFGRVENSFRAGVLLLDDASRLKGTVEALKSQILQYRPDGLVVKKIALLCLDKDSKEVLAFREWLRNLYTTVDTINISDSGKFQFDVKDTNLATYDVLWFHIGGQDWPVNAEYSVSAAVNKYAINPNVYSEIKKYISNGGGLVLSGLALSFLPELELESSAPNECYWGPMYLPDEKYKSIYGACKSLGIKPLDKNHIIFSELPADGFSAWEYDDSELVTKAVWHRPSSARQEWGKGVWPTQGKVIAEYFAEGVEVSQDFAVIVDYSDRTTGRVIAAGDGIDMILGQQSQNMKPAFRSETNQEKLLKNIITYCSGKKN